MSCSASTDYRSSSTDLYVSREHADGQFRLMRSAVKTPLANLGDIAGVEALRVLLQFVEDSNHRPPTAGQEGPAA
jgi:hypothetical protein